MVLEPEQDAAGPVRPLSGLHYSVADLHDYSRSLSSAVAPAFFHVVNVLQPSPTSDLRIAQPITIEALCIAKKVAELLCPEAPIRLAATHFAEDAGSFPAGFQRLAELNRSALDLGSFDGQLKLPLLWDILDVAMDGARAWQDELQSPRKVFVILTNIDIAPLPHFYRFVRDIASSGLRAFAINGRPIPAVFNDARDISWMWSTVGESHPGYDCFVIELDLLKQFTKSLAIIGAGFVMRSLIYNMVAHTADAVVLTDAHATFHVGVDRAWQQDPRRKDYIVHNQQQARKLWQALSKDWLMAERLRTYARETRETWLGQEQTEVAAPPWWRETAARARWRLRRVWRA